MEAFASIPPMARRPWCAVIQRIHLQKLNWPRSKHMVDWRNCLSLHTEQFSWLKMFFGVTQKVWKCWTMSRIGYGQNLPKIVCQWNNFRHAMMYLLELCADISGLESIFMERHWQNNTNLQTMCSMEAEVLTVELKFVSLRLYKLNEHFNFQAVHAHCRSEMKLQNWNSCYRTKTVVLDYIR